MIEHSLNRDLINAANIIEGLVNKDGVVNDETSFIEYHKKNSDLYVLVNANPIFFQFSKDDVFTVKEDVLLKNIYGHNDPNYVGFQNAFTEYEFLCDYRIKDEFQRQLKAIMKTNQQTKLHIEILKRKGQTVGAFQTRNIPHFGHERIIKHLLQIVDHVVVNPMIGPKKAQDLQLEDFFAPLENYLIKKFGGNISVKPIIANMYYAGPREAIHHAKMRKNIGFTHFTVGRDHAGSNGVYASDAAKKLANKHRKTLGIDLICHDGAVFCTKCNQTILVGECSHSKESFVEISGSEFRNCLDQGSTYKYADPKIQSILRTNS